MRLLCCLMLVFFIAGCVESKFINLHDVRIDDLGTPRTIPVNKKECTLYVRTVVKVREKKRIFKYRRTKPGESIYYTLKALEDGMVIDNDSVIIVEEQYLILYGTGAAKKALILTNIPNYRQKLFKNEFDKKQGEDLAKNYKSRKIPKRIVDIRRLNQFRFGNVTDTTNGIKITFYDVKDFDKNHNWYLVRQEGNTKLRLKQFEENDAYNAHFRVIEKAFPFELDFIEVQDFEFAYKDHRKVNVKNRVYDTIKKKDVTVKTKEFIDPSNHQISNGCFKLYRHGGKWYIVFSLETVPIGMDRNIVFTNGRVYAAPFCLE